MRRTRPRALRRSLGEEPLAPLALLEDQIAGRVERAELPEEERSWRLGGDEAGECPPAPPCPPSASRRRPDGVDLVDEDDALPAPLAREPLRAAGEDADDDRVDPDERRREAGARDRDERRVEPGRERLREHGLPRTRRTQEEEPALPLASRTLERLARLPDRDDAAHLLLRLRLPANVGELHAPLGVARLEGLDLGEVHEQERPEEDREVHEHVEGEDDQQGQDLDEERPVDVEQPREDATTATVIATLSQKRQNHTRRCATTSSSRS